MRKGEELKAPRYASAAVTRDYITTRDIIPTAILVSPPKPKVVTTVVSVMVGAFGGILLDFFYYNLSSDCITEPYRKYYGRFY